MKDFTLKDEELEEELTLPRVRLELWGRGGALGQTRIKKGPEYNARRIDLHKDTRMPHLPIFGYRVLADVRFHEDWLVGVHATGMSLEGPKRRLHYRGIGLQGRSLDPLPSRTQIDFLFAEAYVRLVFRDNARVRLMIGTGLAYASMRLRIRNQTQRADGSLDDYLAPTVNYYFSFRLHPRFVIWVESSNALLSLRFPSYASEVRAGFRLPMGQFEVCTGVGISSVMIEDVRDLWGPSKRNASFRWRRASWTLVTLELGVTWRF